MATQILSRRQFEALRDALVAEDITSDDGVRSEPCLTLFLPFDEAGDIVRLGHRLGPILQAAELDDMDVELWMTSVRYSLTAMHATLAFRSVTVDEDDDEDEG